MIASPDNTPWVDGLTISQVLHQTALHDPDHEALIFPQLRLRATYAQFDAMVDEAARGLMALGLAKGDHLALWCTNWPQWVVIQFATARIGVVLVTVNPANRAAELEHVLRQSDAKALALIDQFKTSNYFEILDHVCPDLARACPGKLHSDSLPQLRWVISLHDRPWPGMTTWSEVLERGRKEVTAADLGRRARLPAPQDPINIQYTSGTTGHPRGATLSHRNLLLNAYYIGACQELSHDDRICICVPFYHCFGCVLGTIAAAVYGATMVVPYEYFDPGKTLESIAAERCTSIYGVPTMFIAELEHPDFAKYDLSSLRTGIMAGSPCPIELMRKVTGVMGAKQITIAYGQTEASPVITQTRAQDPINLRVETVGRPLPGVEVRIVDPQTRAVLPPGQAGELCARGHVVMLGYYNMPEATAATIDSEGWLHTGDLGVCLPNGYYHITGRLRDMIIRGGEKIYPREIEETLYLHPDIAEAQVLGVPDHRFGEAVLACIKLRADSHLTEEAVRDFCRDRLAHFKVPRYVRFVDEFPLTVTGKVQKYKIREQAIHELHLEQEAEVKTA